MLTRLEADGFKNLLAFEVDFSPFTCIAGPNAAGKSNIFDAIQFLSLLADHTFMEAIQLVRGHPGLSTDPGELFYKGESGGARRMKLAAEMIVPKEVTDDFGRAAEASITYLRYELELAYEPPGRQAGLGQVRLIAERLSHINLSDAAQRLRFRHSAREFRGRVLKGRRSGSAFISTRVEDGRTIVQTHQDGGSRGQPRPSAADTAPRTIVSTTTTASDPTILAARRELQSWRQLALEPSALRAADHFSAPSSLAANGAHLPATLYRLASSSRNPESVYARISQRLARLLGPNDVRVARDDARQLLTIEMRERKGAFHPARALSEGTLRYLALCVLSEDPLSTGLWCMEEPENGIHPGRLGAMLDLLGDMAVDPSVAPSDENPVRQIVVNTHSPYLVQLQMSDRSRFDLLFAESVTIRGRRGLAQSVRLRPIVGSWRSSKGAGGIGPASVLTYLSQPPEVKQGKLFF